MRHPRRTQRGSASVNRPSIEDKESLRWIEGLRVARDVAAVGPNTTCICVSDSESDIYEMFSEPRSNSADGSVPEIHILVRACQTRLTETGNWLNDVRATNCLYRNSVSVSSRREKIAANKHKREMSRDARIADVEIRATTVTLCPPYRFDRKLRSIAVSVVLIEEPSPPAGCEPIQWLLVTTLPIATVDAVQEIVASYCLRWQVEIFFKTLKSGCRAEERLFEQQTRTLNCLAVYSIIAWRVMYLCRLGRECLDLDCEVVFEPSEWKSVYAVIHRGKPLPATPPRMNEMVCMVASPGGYIKRQTSDPGPQTLWIGLQKRHCLSLAWKTIGPDT